MLLNLFLNEPEMKQTKNATEYVVLVNASGKKTGLAEKIDAHENGWLHRAFSIFIFNDHGEILLQQRALSKYHFAGMWTNACCSHPKPGEKVTTAAKRRLREELGITTALVIHDPVKYCFYDEKSGLTEHEFDYVLSGRYSGFVDINPVEVMAVRWLTARELSTEIARYPQKFTPWFKRIMQEKSLFNAMKHLMKSA